MSIRSLASRTTRRSSSVNSSARCSTIHAIRSRSNRAHGVSRSSDRHALEIVAMSTPPRYAPSRGAWDRVRRRTGDRRRPVRGSAPRSTSSGGCWHPWASEARRAAARVPGRRNHGRGACRVAAIAASGVQREHGQRPVPRPSRSTASRPSRRVASSPPRGLSWCPFMGVPAGWFYHVCRGVSTPLQSP